MGQQALTNSHWQLSSFSICFASSELFEYIVKSSAISRCCESPLRRISISIANHAPILQTKAHAAHRAQLIEQARKAYAEKLVAEKAGGQKATREWIRFVTLASLTADRELCIGDLSRQVAVALSLAWQLLAPGNDQCFSTIPRSMHFDRMENDGGLTLPSSAVITDPEDPKFDVEKLIASWIEAGESA